MSRVEQKFAVKASLPVDGDLFEVVLKGEDNSSGG